jgi:hypothetical protein
MNIFPPRRRVTPPSSQASPRTTVQPLASRVISRPKPAAQAKEHPPLVLENGRQIQIPITYLTMESKPLSAFDDNPVLGVNGAAEVVGVSAECMRKWRQRDQGPDYIQYGLDGPVRYELSTLMAFRLAHRVKVGLKR